MANTVDKVLAIAKAEVGYLEKKNGDERYLYDKRANAGYNNYTKYGKEMHEIYPSVMDYPAAWCDCFVDWCFYKAYGVATAKSLLDGNFDDYTVASALMYKNHNAWYTNNPKVGDQVFFKNSYGGICHTGLVIAVDNLYIHTIEGNTSAALGVVANGGGVAQKKYALNYNRIAGYGRPKYDKGNSNTNTVVIEPVRTNSVKYTKKQFIKDVQKAIGAKVDGIAGPETLSKTITVSKSKNRKHAVVKPIQKYLNKIGYNCGIADGIAGAKFDAAVKAYQKANSCVADGEITARNKTWKKLLGL